MNLLIKNCLAITLLATSLTACDKNDITTENASEKLGSVMEGTAEGMKNATAKAGDLVDATGEQLENVQAKAGDLVDATGEKMDNAEVALKEGAQDTKQDMKDMKNNMMDKIDTACNDVTKENC